MLFFGFYAAILTRLKFRNISMLNDSFQRSISLLIFNIAEHKISCLFFWNAYWALDYLTLSITSTRAKFSSLSDSDIKIAFCPSNEGILKLFLNVNFDVLIDTLKAMICFCIFFVLVFYTTTKAMASDQKFKNNFCNLIDQFVYNLKSLTSQIGQIE